MSTPGSTLKMGYGDVEGVTLDGDDFVLEDQPYLLLGVDELCVPDGWVDGLEVRHVYLL